MTAASSADAALARRLALAAGEALLALRRDQRLVGAALGKAGDLEAHRIVAEGLGAARPHDALLSEEGLDDTARLSARRVWIVDPLDGTAEYEERRDDWAVHVALAVDGEPGPGAIAVPARGLCLDTLSAACSTRTAGRMRILVSRRRPPAGAEAFASALGAELLPMGSAGAKTAAVLLGEADLYLHAGGLAEWDWVAPVAVARAAGLWCGRLDGSPLIANQARVMTPDLLICPPALLPRVRAALAVSGLAPLP